MVGEVIAIGSVSAEIVRESRRILCIKDRDGGE
jgi:hypothetical protein